MKNTNTKHDIPRLKRYWLVDNPGILTRIAEQYGVTKVFVGDVFHNRRKSRDGQIEHQFAKLGAPGFTKEYSDVAQ